MISHLYANYAIHKSHWVVELAVNLVIIFFYVCWTSDCFRYTTLVYHPSNICNLNKIVLAV